MGTFQSFRKAYGAIKDSTTVGLAKVNSDFKELDVAVVKTTNHYGNHPNERYVRKIFVATSVVRPRGNIAYCIHALSKRLDKTRNWIVAIKVLIVIHRTLREGDPSFREELLMYSHKGHIFRIPNFKDDSSPNALDCSSWVRIYALYLEERLACYRFLKYDIEAERLTRSSPGASKVHSRTRLLTSNELLEHLPALQQFLNRLMGCQPEGAACNNYLIQYSLALVLKESLKIYCAINDGIINLVDMFFDMSKHDAVKTLDIYIRAGQQADYLAEFYEFCKWLDLAQNFQFPTLRQPPPSFLATMEEYVREAPQIGSVLHRPGSGKTDEASDDERETPEEILKTEPEPQLELPPLISTDDLLGLGEVNPMPPEVEEKSNLAIIQPGGVNQSSTSNALMELGTSGWELPLVSTSTNNNTIPPQVQGGSFDKLFFDSLYEDENARRQLQMQNVGYGQFEMEEGAMVMQANNPFEQQQDPFFMFNGTDNVQMAHHHQQQQQTMMHQQQQSPPLVMQENQMQSMMMVPYESPPQHIQFPEARQQPMDMGIGVGMGMGVGSSNPFEDPFSVCPQKTNQHGNSGLM